MTDCRSRCRVRIDRSFWGRAKARSPESITTVSGCGFRTCRFAAGRSVPLRSLHMRKQRRRRPAIELESIVLLIIAERGARFHPGLAVDLVVVIAARGEDFLHAVEIAGGKLRDFAPRRLERPRIGNAIAEMA